VFVLRLFRNKGCLSGIAAGGPIKGALFSLSAAAEGNLRDVTMCFIRPLSADGICKALDVYPAVDVVPVVEVMPTLFPEAAI